MDWTALALSVVSGILGISAVSVFVSKYMPALVKWSTLAKDAVETLNDLAVDLSKGTLTPAEMTQLQTDVAKFKTDLAVAMGK